MVIKKQKKKNKQVNECRSVIKYKFSCVKGIWKVICDKVIKAGAWLLSCCQRKIWLCNEMKSQFSSFAVSTSSWLLSLRESRYFLVLNSHLAHTFSSLFTHFLHIDLSLSPTPPHSLSLHFLCLSLFRPPQWWLPTTWGGRRREYSGRSWRSTSSALTSATRRGSTPPSRRITAGPLNTMKPSLCEW